MSGAKAILKKVFRLFVDDAFLAVAVLFWLIVVWLLLPWILVPATWRGVTLFLGLAILLLGSVLLRVRKH
ncbi:MAG TPA: hypothetical protein VFJ15_00220 [Oleiagrimonas sp.]|nr:hypothetical protein [Oleiagrimonas sp.]